MRRLLLALALLSTFTVAAAEDKDAPAGFRFDARDFALSLGNDRVQWRFEALDLRLEA